MGGGLLKNLSLRGKVARWAAVAACVVGAASGNLALASPVQAIHRVNDRGDCDRRSDFLALGTQRGKACFADKGIINYKGFPADYVSSGNNDGYLETNKGRIDFTRNGFRNLEKGTEVTKIVIY